MPFKYEINGQVVEFDKEPNEQDIDEVASRLGGRQDIFTPSNLPNVSTPRTQQSPLSINDRLRLSFADEIGRENFLKDKFQFVERLPNGKYAVGNSPEEVMPIDPEGLFNDVLGDLADVVGEIPVIAGQIIGGGLGAVAEIPTGPVPTTIIGGGAGAAGGELVKQLIGRGLGVRGQSALEEATDVAVTGAFGAAAEGLVLGTRALGKNIIVPKLTRMLDKTVNRSPGHARGIARIFRVLANVPEDSTETAFKYGIERTLGDPFNMNPNSVVSIVDDVIKALDDTTRTLGDDVAKQSNKFIGKAGARKVNVNQAFKIAKRKAQDMGILDDFGRINKRYTNTRDIKPIKDLLSELGVEKRVGKNFQYVAGNKELPIGKVIKLSRAFGQKFEGTSGGLQNILYETFNGVDDFPGIRGQLRILARQVGVDDYIRATDKYHRWTSTLDEVKALKGQNKDILERFIRGLERKSLVMKRTLQEVNASSKTKFLPKMEMWNAAQDFRSANPNILRFAAITGLLGSIFGFDSNQSRAATIGGAVLLGTPAGLRMLLRAGAKTGLGIRAGAQVPKQATKIGKTIPSLLRTIIQPKD